MFLNFIHSFKILGNRIFIFVNVHISSHAFASRRLSDINLCSDALGLAFPTNIKHDDEGWHAKVM